MQQDAHGLYGEALEPQGPSTRLLPERGRQRLRSRDVRTTKLVIQNGRCAYGMYSNAGGGVTSDVCAVSPTMPTTSTQTPFGGPT